MLLRSRRCWTTPATACPVTPKRRCHPGLNSSGCIGDFPDFAIATFSSCGPAVDVTPPGVHIVSAVDVSSGKALGSISG